ncbi:PREDICTED: uncharacterized protein LOC108746813 isoform X2 [Trachymyrmex septentrionalis]|uniref:uncharacterized protein LOC108746813 isoform X2 n=1 Tax=Trachymyrmex septentrionalis TaxID=34720 RepID=UPI00084F3183|nr:PREDICTED: uncharacterized protein LOC108746813 isoform X2 [Trachymyrmex septentrionalis]
MRRRFVRYDKQFDTSTEDDFSSDLDLPNPKVTQSYRKLRLACQLSKNEKNDQSNLKLSSTSLHQDPVTNNRFTETKLFTGEVDHVATPQRISNIESSASYVCLKRYEPQGVIVKGKQSSDGEKFERKNKFNEKIWKQSSTPRIVRAIRQNSKKRNSKSSVIVLYHGRFNIPQSSSNALVQLPKSNQIVKTSHVPRSEVINCPSPDKSKIIETPETLSPRYSLRKSRRKNTSKRYHISRQQPFLNVNIYHANRVERFVSPLQNRWTSFKRQIKINSKYKDLECTAKLSQDPVRPQLRTLTCHINEHSTNQRSRKCITQERIRKKECSLVEVVTSKPMDCHLEKAENPKGRKQSASCSNLGLPMKQIEIYPKKTSIKSTFANEGNETDSRSRVFPFQATPSGNLKIIPNQVVFESKKFSVLAADPRQTKVDVKAELNRSGNNVVGTSVFDSPNRTRYIDLPPGITPSTIDQLQAQKKLPHIEGSYRSRTQSSTKFYPSEMEQNHSVQSTSHQLPPMNEIPLASLGFTNEQPIDWNNIILPEKSDLYQELAIRITNYKNADCVIRIDHDEFHCHLLVLQSYSTFFDEKNCKNIDLSGSSVTSKAFSIIYDWMISPINESCQLLRRDNILEIFMAAQYLGIKELEEQCWAFIDNDELFSEDTAFLLYLDAKKIENTAVMELMVPRIMKFFLMLVSTKDFLELSVDELCLLLKSNYICVNSEMEVLMSAVRWLMHDWNERKRYMLEVLKCVRFGLIAPWQLVDVKRNPENPEFMELMSYPEIQKMVDDGLAFVIIKYWYGNQTEDYYHWIDLLGLSEPTNRNWAGEDKNYVTYREFLLYLEEYQKTNISELKTRKIQTKPIPSNSPPKESSLLSLERIRADCNKNCCIDSHLLEQYNTMQTQEPKKYISKITTSSGMVMSPEILTNCLSNMGKNNMRANKTQYDGNKNNKPIIRDTKYCETSELSRKSLDFLKNTKSIYEHHQHEIPTVIDKSRYEDRQEKNYHRKHWEQNVIFPIKKQQNKIMKKSICMEDHVDSAKSEEEAATMIQATYRGYKVRRKFDEIKKSSSEEKQNAQKVAELLSMSTNQCGWSFQKSLHPFNVSNNITNHTKNTLHYM